MTRKGAFMRTRSPNTSLASLVILLLLYVHGGAASVSGDVIHVPGDYPTIQEGIDAAINGDIVEVADGTYTGTGNKDLDYDGRLITLRCPNGPAACIIDCEGEGRAFVFETGETSAAVVDGFTVSNGDTGDYNGAGIYCRWSGPTVANCVFENNTPGVIHCRNDCVLTVTNCIFRDNAGAGITTAWGGSPTVINSTFIRNSGGGIHNLDGDVVVKGCTFELNTDRAVTTSGGSLNVYDSTFRRNSAASGSGVKIAGSDAQAAIFNCVFTGNVATQEYSGGGAGVRSFAANTLIANSTFVANLGAYGPAIQNDANGPGHMTITNTIVWGSGEDPIVGLPASRITATFNNIEGGWPGLGNIDIDPLFEDAQGPDGVYGTEDDNLRLTPDSGCVNAGWDYLDDSPATDIEGNPRIQACRIDMGTYESPYAQDPFPDCDGDNVDDDCQIDDGASDDCNRSQVPDLCDIADGYSQDCNLNAIPDECDVADGVSLDCNANIIPDECEPPDDCNDNGTQDICDIASGVSEDCNENQVPDECDVTSGASQDSDGNSVPDECTFYALIPAHPPSGVPPYPAGVTIIGNRVFLSGEEAYRIWLEVWMGNWGPRLLKVFQASIDPAGYSSGDGAAIGPVVEECTDDSICTETLGFEECLMYCPNGDRCFSEGAACSDGGLCLKRFCRAGYQDRTREDFVVIPGDLCGVDVHTPLYRYGCVAPPPYITDAGIPGYGGTIVLDLPSDAAGTYVIDFDFSLPNPQANSPTFMMDEFNVWIPIAYTTPAIVTVCADGPPGPCCLSSGVCAMLTADCCAEAGGVVVNDAVTCEGDTDGDGLDGVCGDECPDDVAKTLLGECGCGVAEGSCSQDGAAIPTISTWGLAVTGLSVLILSRFYFSRRQDSSHVAQ